MPEKDFFVTVTLILPLESNSVTRTHENRFVQDVVSKEDNKDTEN